MVTAAYPPFQTVNDISDFQSYSFTESDTAWYLIEAPKPCVLQPVDSSTVVRFRPKTQGGFEGATFGTASGGRAAPLLAVGKWWIQLPVTGSSAASRTLMLLDYALYSGAPELLAVATNTGTTPAAPTAVTVATAASTAILVADAARGRYMITNTDTANPVYLGLGGHAAVVGSGVRIAPGGSYIVEPYDGFASLAVAGRAATADVDVAVQAWS